MQRNKQADIKTDKQFQQYIDGYTEVSSLEDLREVLGATVRYKITHYLQNGTSETLYRIGGILNKVDNNGDYICLFNPTATAQKNYRNGWSVQLRTKKITVGGGFSKKEVLVPVFPWWEYKNNLGALSSALKVSSQGIMTIQMWYFKPQPREIRNLQSLIARLEAENVSLRSKTSPHRQAAVPPKSPNRNASSAMPQGEDAAANKTTPKPRTFFAMF